MVAHTVFGVDNRVRRYAEALAMEGYRVDVIALEKKGWTNKRSASNINIYQIQFYPSRPERKLSYVFRYIRFLLKSSLVLTLVHIKKPYRIVHVHNLPDFEVFAAWFVKLTGGKIILDIHDVLPEFYLSKFRSSKQSWVYKTLLLVEKASAAFADHVIVANHIWREKLVSRSVSRERCSCFLNYPDPQIFYVRPRTRTDKKIIIVYPGSLNYHQGLDIAIKGIARAVGEVPEIEFHIYGEGPQKESLEELVYQLDIQETVIFKKFVAMDTIADLIAQADLGIVPKRADSFGNEAFSTKILEFMALGVPAIISRTTIDKYYFNESIVKFFKPGDSEDLAKCIVSLIRDEPLRRQLRANALEYVKINNWRVKKAQYLNVLNSLTSARQKLFNNKIAIKRT